MTLDQFLNDLSAYKGQFQFIHRPDTDEQRVRSLEMIPDPDPDPIVMDMNYCCPIIFLFIKKEGVNRPGKVDRPVTNGDISECGTALHLAMDDISTIVQAADGGIPPAYYDDANKARLIAFRKRMVEAVGL